MTTLFDDIVEGLRLAEWQVEVMSGDIFHPAVHKPQWRSAVAERTGYRFVFAADASGSVDHCHGCHDAEVR